MRAAITMSALVAAPMLLAAPGSAQVPWEAPQLLGPSSPAGVGLHLADYRGVNVDGLGLLLVVRTSDAPGIGFRAAVARDADDDVVAAGGIDVSASIARASAEFPLDLLWTSGAGLAYQQDLFQAAVPIGVAAGRAIGSRQVWFSPYVAARMVAEYNWGDAAPEPAFDLGFASDVGADVSFDPGRNFILRFAASLGDRSALVIGAHVRLGGAPPRPPSADR